MNYTIIYHVSSSLEMSEGFVYQSSREWLGKAISRAFQICYLMYLFSTNYPLLVDKGGGRGRCRWIASVVNVSSSFY